MRGVSVPFNVNDIARQQQILLEDPFLNRLNLNIVPGLAPGDARLTGEVTEALPYSLIAQIANDQSPTVGEVRGQLQGVIGNLLGVGDVLAIEYGRSLALNDGAISYSVPISSDDTRFSIRYDINSNQVVAENLSPLNITSRYQSIGVGLSRPFFRTPEQNLTLGLSLEWRQSQRGAWIRRWRSERVWRRRASSLLTSGSPPCRSSSTRIAATTVRASSTRLPIGRPMKLACVSAAA
jgi:hemolysin activation/secretion protein